ncbi:MAG: hypothetical protein PHX83_16585 [Acidobacteriia bacterium]|nr:hypothetical protein [Terriglobia bacterium]
MMRSLCRRMAMVWLASVGLTGTAALSWAQGCAMCYTSVANSTQAQQARTTLAHAILLLLVPAVTLFVGAFALAYRYRNSFQETPSEKKAATSVDASDLAA